MVAKQAWVQTALLSPNRPGVAFGATRQEVHPAGGHHRTVISMKVLLCFLALAAAMPSLAADRTVKYVGTARALRTQEVLYREHHLLLYKGERLVQRVVLYTCPGNVTFARKVADYPDAQSPNFQFEDATTGMRQGVRMRNGQRQMYYRGNDQAVEKSAPLPVTAGVVIDTGFDAYIRANWQKLLDGESLPLAFLVPSRSEVMSFKVRHLRRADLDGTAVEVFEMKLAGVLGWVLPAIEVSYSADQRLLLRYVGLSDLRDRSGDNFQADISFPPGERTDADPDEVRIALDTTLARCP
jgi:hypothetical protein